MSTKLFSGTITTRYGEPEKDIYQQVIDLVQKERIAKSRAQLLLVKRGLQHTQNPEPLVKTVKEVVEKIVPKDRYPYCKDCAGKPKVDESTPQKQLGIQEHVSIDEPITDGHIGGDTEFEQRPSGDIRTTQDKAVSPPDTALDVKKSPKANSDGKKGGSGWAIAGGVGIVGLIIYLLVK